MQHSSGYRSPLRRVPVAKERKSPPHTHLGVTPSSNCHEWGCWGRPQDGEVGAERFAWWGRGLSGCLFDLCTTMWRVWQRNPMHSWGAGCMYSL